LREVLKMAFLHPETKVVRRAAGFAGLLIPGAKCPSQSEKEANTMGGKIVFLGCVFLLALTSGISQGQTGAAEH
jgi:hypothetical protein